MGSPHDRQRLAAGKLCGSFQRLAKKHGMQLSIEAYDGCPCIDQAYAGRADMPMGEFWVGGRGLDWCKEMASASHVYGKPVTGAEAFTSVPDQARWQHHPASIKAIGDAAFCEGINRFLLCFFTHQPWLNLRSRHDVGWMGLPLRPHGNLVGTVQGLAPVPGPLPVSAAKRFVCGRYLLSRRRGIRRGGRRTGSSCNRHPPQAMSTTSVRPRCCGRG